MYVSRELQTILNKGLINFSEQRIQGTHNEWFFTTFLQMQVCPVPQLQTWNQARPVAVKVHAIRLGQVILCERCMWCAIIFPSYFLLDASLIVSTSLFVLFLFWLCLLGKYSAISPEMEARNQLAIWWGESLLADDPSQPFHILKVNSGVGVEHFSTTGSMQTRF